MDSFTTSTPRIVKRPIKTALHQAVLDCRIHQVRLLISKHGSNVDCKDLYGRTPLMLTCLIANEEHGTKMASMFLGIGCYLNSRDNMGRSALAYACMNGREEIVKKILKEDVIDINEPDTDGNTPLHHSATCRNPNIVRMLVEAVEKYGLNVDFRNLLGYTPLLLACKMGHYTSACVLLTHGRASPTLRDNELFLNTLEWVQRSSNKGDSLYDRRVLVPSSREIIPSFTNTSYFYHRPITPVCRHTKSPMNPLSWSTGSMLRLPTIVQDDHNLHDGSELLYDGRDSRQLLLDEIQSIGDKSRPFSTKSALTRPSHPPTAKLMAAGRKNRKYIVHDMEHIFQAYSEQYDPFVKKRDTGPSIHIEPPCSRNPTVVSV